MARAIPILLLLVLVLAVASWVLRRVRHEVTRARGARAARRPGGYEWDRRSAQASRRIKGVAGPQERPHEIIEWLDGHEGVEAYVEPKTAMSPLSVVLVDGAGEWRRFELGEDRGLRAIAADRQLPVYDVARTGYPERMRRSRG